MSDDLQELAERVNLGTLGGASKSELQRYAVSLTRSNAYASFGAQQFAQVSETVRLLLNVKIGGESANSGKRLSIIALGISILALIATVVQAVAALWPRR